MNTHGCQRAYDALEFADVDTGVGVENPYRGMQTALVEMLEEHGRSSRWPTEDALVE